MRLTLGFSPCPNDTFIFDALINEKLDTQGIEFSPLLADVQTLNQQAIDNQLDITKISYGVYPLVLENYELLNSGSALGTGVGPLLIANSDLTTMDINDSIIAIPGENTTAHLLFGLAFPNAKNKIFLPYDKIENYVLSSNQKNTAGVIIHENRFTYQDRGLKKIMDLGDFWQRETGAPIPLGGIVGKKTLPASVLKTVDQLIKQSIEYAFNHYPELPSYVKIHAQEMSENVMRQHIDLYVNNFSLDLGTEGKKAVQVLLNVYKSLHQNDR